MKTRLNILVTIVTMACFSSLTLAQVRNTVSTSVGATIVKALSLSQNTPLHFGSMSIPTAPVSVILSTSNGRVATSPSNITLLAQSPVSENATYTVSGSDAATYAITLPANGVVSITNGTEHLDIVDFVAHTVSSGVDGNTGLLSASGTDSFTVGATIKLGNAQPYGSYTGTFGITVNYN